MYYVETPPFLLAPYLIWSFFWIFYGNIWDLTFYGKVTGNLRDSAHIKGKGGLMYMEGGGANRHFTPVYFTGKTIPCPRLLVAETLITSSYFLMLELSTHNHPLPCHLFAINKKSLLEVSDDSLG